jgi:hypothetical protein
VYTDANIVIGAESADLFFDCWCLKVIGGKDRTLGIALNSSVTQEKD